MQRIRLLGTRDGSRALSLGVLELEEGEILESSSADLELEEGENRETSCHLEHTPPRQLPAEYFDSSPPKRARLGMSGYVAKREAGSMWDGLRQEWARSERLPARRGEHPGLGYKGFLSSRKDFGEWILGSDDCERETRRRLNLMRSGLPDCIEID